MSASGLSVIDTTVQETNAWLGAIMHDLGIDDRHRAFQALRGTLHAVRDHLRIESSAQLSAQLPTLIRGIYYEGWNPSRVPVQERSRDAFLHRVAAAFERANPDLDLEPLARAALRVLAARISPGEAEDVRHMMPAAVQELWPTLPVAPPDKGAADHANAGGA